MWFLFHHKVKTKLVEDGETFVDICPQCRRRARFYEVEVSENVGVFFIDLIGDKERKYRCGACGSVFDRRETTEDEEAVAPPVKSAREIERDRLAAEARQMAAEQRRRELAEAKANRIEDELAELKKRLGR